MGNAFIQNFAKNCRMVTNATANQDTNAQIVEKITAEKIRFINDVNLAIRKGTTTAEIDTEQYIYAAMFKEQMEFLLAGEDEDTLIAMGFTAEETFSHCRYNRFQTCEWKLFRHSSYGNCFSFNSNVTNQFQTERVGQQFGLELLAHTNPSEYLDTSDTVGLRIEFHSPAVNSFPENNGYTIVPGFDNTFAMRYKKIMLMRKPYGKCVRDISEVEYFYYEKDYSTEACKNSFLQYTTIAKCGCGNPKWPIPDGCKSCNNSNSLMQCVINIHENSTSFEKARQLRINCEETCRTEIYPTIPIVTKRIPRSIRSYTKEELKSIAKVYAYIETLSFVNIVERPSITIPMVISNVGGVLGIALGASVISLLEVMIIFFRVLATTCK